MKKTSHRTHHQQSSWSQPRCPCGNNSCEVMEIVRLIAETTDNFLLLQGTLHTTQQQLRPLLDQMHHDQRASLERWQIEQDIYRGHMAASVRPTMRWQQFSPLEEELSRRTHRVGEWYHHEQQRLEARVEHLQEAMHNHEVHLEECASRFVRQPLHPACVSGIAAVVQEHLARIEARLPRLQKQADEEAHRIAEIQTRYQAEVRRLQEGQQGTETQLAFGQREATTQWVVRNLFALGTPQSLTLTHQVYGQLKATNQLEAHVRLQRHFFWYCEQVWNLCQQADTATRVQILMARHRHWSDLFHSFRTTTTHDSRTILLALAPSH